MPVSLTLKELESITPSSTFERINRSVIISLSEITDFNHWENEKYILNTVTGKEFTITRKRLNQIKALLAAQTDRENHH